MQHPAMWRIQGDAAIVAPEACVKPALGAMPMQDIDVKLPGQGADPQGGGYISHPQQSRHGNLVNAKGSKRPELVELLGGVRIGHQAINHDADLVAAFRQCLGQVGNVTEQPADRRPKDLKNTQRALVQLRSSVRG